MIKNPLRIIPSPEGVDVYINPSSVISIKKYDKSGFCPNNFDANKDYSEYVIIVMMNNVDWTTLSISSVISKLYDR